MTFTTYAAAAFYAREHKPTSIPRWDAATGNWSI